MLSSDALSADHVLVLVFLVYFGDKVDVLKKKKKKFIRFLHHFFLTNLQAVFLPRQHS